MDAYIEQLVKYKKTNKDITSQSLILAGGVFAVLAAAYLGMYFVAFLGISVGSLLALALIAGICYGVFKLILKYNVEYEYIFTNGELDFDKITGQSRRKRLLSVDTKIFSEFGKLTQEKLNSKYDSRVFAYADINRLDSYYAVFETSGLGKTLLVFNPNERMLEGVTKSLSSRVKVEI